MRVVVLDDYQDVSRSSGPWERLGNEVEVTVLREHIPGDQELRSALSGAQVVVAMRERTPFSRQRLEHLSDLRLLVTTGMGNAAIDVDAARELGIVVCGTAMSANSTSELTWALILAVTRGVAQEDAAVRSGGWQHTIGPGLEGKTLGIVGLGKQGSRVAAVGKAFGMRLVAWSQNLTAERAASSGAELVSKEQLFSTSDVVTLHVKLSERTTGLVGAAELRLMQPTAYLVNTSRGQVVDAEALADALRNGSIAGAGLDVFDQEPLPPDSPIRSLPRTVLTPHLGYVSTDSYRICYTDAVEDIEAWLRGDPIRVL